MGSPYQSQSASGYNSSPPADDGSTVAANKITWAGIKTKLADSLKTLADAINTQLRSALNVSPSTTSAPYTTLVGDHLTTIEVTGTTTISLGDAATMIAQSMGYTVTVYNKGTNTVSVTPITGTNKLNGQTAGVITLPPQTSGTFTVAQSGVDYEMIASSNPQAFSAQRGFISGFTYANNGTDSIDVAAGAATDSTNVYVMSGAALTKNITASWAVGNAQGMLDTGSVGNSDYYLFVIARPDTGVVDYLASLSPTAPTMPANYTYKKLIGWFKRLAGSNVTFTTYETAGGGLELQWTTPTLDVNLSNTLTTSRRTDAVKVPLNFSTVARLRISMQDATSATATVTCPDEADVAPSSSAAPLYSFIVDSVSQVSDSTEKMIRTSSAGLIAARSSVATMDAYKVVTVGFMWARRN